MAGISGILDIGVSSLTANRDTLTVIGENIANANSTTEKPGAEPYRRRMVSFADTLDRQLGVFEGAVCAKGPNGYSYTFPGGLPTEFSIRADAASLTEIQAIAAGYPGSGSPAIELADGSKVSVNEYAVNHPQGRIDLLIRFSRP